MEQYLGADWQTKIQVPNMDRPISFTLNKCILMKIIAKKANVASTAVQHVAKHFDLVLGIDIHWTKLPMPPFPLPLPHPFIGFIFDPIGVCRLQHTSPFLVAKDVQSPREDPYGSLSVCSWPY